MFFFWIFYTIKIVVLFHTRTFRSRNIIIKYNIVLLCRKYTLNI